MDVHPLLDNGANGHAGVQARVGVLENHLVPALESLGLRLGQFAQLSAFIEDGTAGFGINPQQGAAAGGFAAARFPHQAKGFALENIKGHVVHRFDGFTVFGGEIPL